MAEVVNGSPVEGSLSDDQFAGILGILNAAEEPATFFESSSVNRESCQEALQLVYEVANEGWQSSVKHTGRNGTAPPAAKLITTGFHVEQVWAQVDAIANTVMKRIRKAVKHTPEDLVLLDPDMEEAVEELIGDKGGDVEAPDSEQDKAASSDDSDGADEHDELVGFKTPARRLEDINYDEMLASGRRTRSAGPPGTAPRTNATVYHTADEAESSEDADGDAAGRDDDEDEEQPEGGATGALQNTDAELLPTEDDFLRLDDMEAFVQHAEAAHAAGDTGGFDTFRNHLEGNQLGGPARSKRRRATQRRSDPGTNCDAADSDSDDPGGERGRRGADEDDDDEDDDSDVDLYAALDGDADGSEDEGGLGGGGEIGYDEFFSRKAPYSGRGGGTGGERGGVAQGEQRRAVDAEMVGADDEDGEASASDDSIAEEEENSETVGETDGEVGGESDDEADRQTDRKQGTLSTHEKRQLKVAEQIAAVEEEALAERSWHLRGEATAASRPKDSALELDIDFERTMRPPPEPTFEAAAALEDIIKARIHELRFDNVTRVNLPGPDGGDKRRREQAELDDKKARTGLADEYAASYQQAVAGTTVDKHAKIRADAKALFVALSAKLDALSHLALTPKPQVEDAEVRVEVPAIAMEEAAPIFTSAAAMQAPEEAHVKKKEKQLKAATEVTQADRKAARAAKKRVNKRKHEEKEEAAGVWSHAHGIKSAREDAEAAREAKMAKKKAGKTGVQGGKVVKARAQARDVIATNSTAVFKKLQVGQDGGVVGGKQVGGKKCSNGSVAGSAAYRM